MDPPSSSLDELPSVIPKSEIEILSQEITDEEGLYRVRARKRVHYITIPLLPSPIFDEDTLCRPYLLIPKLPPFPDADWTHMQICQSSDGKVHSSISYVPLARIQSCWHPKKIDILSLPRLSSHNSRVKEVKFEDRIAISKVAIFEWWIPKVEHETAVYETISKYQSPYEHPIAPEFLGYLTENGRVIGFLMERVVGDYASLHDLPACEAALLRLHTMGLVHGDVNRFNFVVDSSTGQARMIDFEHAEPYGEEKAQLELKELRAALSETTGRGAATTRVDGVSVIDTAPVPYPRAG
ncbi:hypothetical protein ACHAPT_005501 [Fusarium lateritium]